MPEIWATATNSMNHAYLSYKGVWISPKSGISIIRLECLPRNKKPKIDKQAF